MFDLGSKESKVYVTFPISDMKHIAPVLTLFFLLLLPATAHAEITGSVTVNGRNVDGAATNATAIRVDASGFNMKGYAVNNGSEEIVLDRVDVAFDSFFIPNKTFPIGRFLRPGKSWTEVRNQAVPGWAVSALENTYFTVTAKLYEKGNPVPLIQKKFKVFLSNKKDAEPKETPNPLESPVGQAGAAAGAVAVGAGATSLAQNRSAKKNGKKRGGIGMGLTSALGMLLALFLILAAMGMAKEGEGAAIVGAVMYLLIAIMMYV